MTEQQLTMFVWNLVDETIEHVFLRFPEDPVTRAHVYRKIALNFAELADDLDLV